MNRPSRFQIMRRNRSKLQRAREEVEAEREAAQAWNKLREQAQAHRAAAFFDTADWLRDTRDKVRAQVRTQEPPRRRWFQLRRPAWL